ncbi:LamG domain-containing protein [Flavobacterium panacagri]|uniref:LamG domain-containing protein n=1 Tax=Flavobacterium panacagri TaxID=3034146 RepID=UPI0025A5E17E|nr:LamG domain-containing protein [Flavobacterium panacagri]
MGLKKYYFAKKKQVKVNDLNISLVAYYKLDSDAIDLVNGVNGTSTNVSYINSGKIGNSATFNGSNSLIIIPNSDNFNFSNSTNDLPFSISFWIYNMGNNASALIYRRGAGATNEQYAIQKLPNGQLVMNLFTNTSNLIQGATSGIADLNTWVHYLVTYDGTANVSGIKWYKNGVLASAAGSMTGTYTKMPIAVQNTVIGRISWTATGFLDARLDEFAIWKNRALTSSEALYLYNSGTGRTFPF